MNISLTPDLEGFIEDKVKSGRYTTASEVVQEALRLLEERERMKAQQLEELERRLAKATEQLDRGEGIPIEDVREELRQLSSQRKTSKHA
jgi:antitoxin ParD1/3/4